MEERQKQPADEINLLDYLIVLAKRKRLIAGITFGAALIAAIVSLLMTPIYRAETRILPPQQGGGGMASQLLSQVAGGAADIAGGLLGVSSPNEMYVEMLKSRTVLDRIVDRFKLQEAYETKTKEMARKALEECISVASDKKSTVITVSVEDRSPEKAAEMANAFVEELKIMMKRLAITEAAQRRLFFEEQLKDAKEVLIKAEEGMKSFQEKTGALQVDEQAKAVIQGIADLRAQIAAKEVQLKVMKSFSTSRNPDYQRVEDELNGMKAELTKLETKDGSNPDPLMPTGRIPSVGTEYVRKFRDLKFSETLFELMAKQYELAKIDEARDTAIIQVIDKAVPPEKRIKPKRAIIVFLTSFASFFIAVFAAFFKEFWERTSDEPETRIKLEELKKFARLK